MLSWIRKLGLQVATWISAAPEIGPQYVCGAICAQRHSGRVCVTAAIDEVNFVSPILVGDVVILASPQDPTEDLVKRVIGLPGDVIEVRQDVVYRNGRKLLQDGPHACPPQRFRSRCD